MPPLCHESCESVDLEQHKSAAACVRTQPQAKTQPEIWRTINQPQVRENGVLPPHYRPVNSALTET